MKILVLGQDTELLEWLFPSFLVPQAVLTVRGMLQLCI